MPRRERKRERERERDCSRHFAWTFAGEIARSLSPPSSHCSIPSNSSPAPPQQEAKFLEDKLKDVQKALKVEIKAKQIVYEEIDFDEGENAIIGKGAFGVVRLAYYQGETVAVKQVKVAASKAFWKEEDAQAVQDFVSEIAIMSPLRHPNIIFFYGGVWLEGASRMCLVVEYAGRGGEFGGWGLWLRVREG